MVRRTEDHRYFAQGGRELLGVTRVLVENNLVDDTHFSDRVRSRGLLVDLLTQYMLKGAELPDWYEQFLPYALAFRRFLDNEQPDVGDVQPIVYNLNSGCAGTADFFCTWRGELTVVDVKLSQSTPWHGVQLAAYAWMKEPNAWFRRRRCGLYLNERGGYRITTFREPDDLEVFLRALANSHWRVKHGSFERPYGKPGDYFADAQRESRGTDVDHDQDERGVPESGRSPEGREDTGSRDRF